MSESAKHSPESAKHSPESAKHSPDESVMESKDYQCTEQLLQLAHKSKKFEMYYLQRANIRAQLEINDKFIKAYRERTQVLRDLTDALKFASISYSGTEVESARKSFEDGQRRQDEL